MHAFSWLNNGAPCIHKLSASERGVDAASLSLFPQLSLNSNIVGSFTLKRPDRRRAEAALWRAAKAEGRAPGAID